MALRKRGKKGYYSAYFRTVKARPDGTLKYATTTVNLVTADSGLLVPWKQNSWKKNEATRLHQQATAQIIKLEIAVDERPTGKLVGDHAKQETEKIFSPRIFSNNDSRGMVVL